MSEEFGRAVLDAFRGRIRSPRRRIRLKGRPEWSTARLARALRSLANDYGGEPDSRDEAEIFIEAARRLERAALLPHPSEKGNDDGR